MEANSNTVFTIGHSTHAMERFASLLAQHHINAVADVRSAPYSRFNPQFNREALERQLVKHGIKYVFLGRELGARPEDASCYEHGRVVYGRLAQTDVFKAGIDRVLRGAKEFAIAVMCAEKEPLECHRTLLVARALDQHGVSVRHIHADGKLESHESAMERLLEIQGVPPGDLFRPREELISEAIYKQEQRIAYVDGTVAAEGVRDGR